MTARTTGRATARARRRVDTLLAALFVLAVVGAGLLALPAPPAGAQPGATTSTLPVDDREFGEIIPKPNTGRAPASASDPGGWLQVSLFFLICGAILLIGLGVWWQSRRTRRRREDAGVDPVSLAKARGEGMRKPR